MPILDVSFLNPGVSKAKGGGDAYGTLVDQLAILENSFEVDGKLSPGDYDLLLKQAHTLYSNPGLTNSQRSNVLVKISQYEKDKSTSVLKDTSDIERLNRENNDDFRRNSIMLANNPQALMTSNAAAMKLKIESLATTIDQIESSGGDSSQHLNEYTTTLGEFQELLQTLDDVERNGNSGKPVGTSVAYITTNSKGEINDIKIGRVGSQSGYVETNGVYGGLQIYGKVNRKEDSKNVFQLGNERFTAPDLLLPDPSNPGAVKQGRLISESQQSQGGKGFDTSAGGQYKVVDPSLVRAQSAIGVGQWAQGEKGMLYQLGANGKYKKYVNMDPAKLGISDNDILRVPRVMESGINAAVYETIDAAAPVYPADFTGPTPVGSPRFTGPTMPSQEQQPSAPTGESRTPGPQSRAPKDASNLATKTINTAKGFLAKIFSS